MSNETPVQQQAELIRVGARLTIVAMAQACEPIVSPATVRSYEAGSTKLTPRIKVALDKAYVLVREGYRPETKLVAPTE